MSARGSFSLAHSSCAVSLATVNFSEPSCFRLAVRRSRLRGSARSIHGNSHARHLRFPRPYVVQDRLIDYDVAPFVPPRQPASFPEPAEVTDQRPAPHGHLMSLIACQHPWCRAAPGIRNRVDAKPASFPADQRPARHGHLMSLISLVRSAIGEIAGRAPFQLPPTTDGRQFSWCPGLDDYPAGTPRRVALGPDPAWCRI